MAPHHPRSARLAFSDAHLQRDRQDRRFGFGTQGAFDAPPAGALEHQVLDQAAAFGTRAVRGNVETEREKRAMHRTDQWRTRALSDFDSHEFGAALFEANLGMSDHGEFEPAGRG